MNDQLAKLEPRRRRLAELFLKGPEALTDAERVEFAALLLSAGITKSKWTDIVDQWFEEEKKPPADKPPPDSAA